MSSGSGRRVTRQDVQAVQDLIERCLQLYMNQKEVVDTLMAQAKIDPDFTKTVWVKLEQENQDFFRAYYLRLMVKHQIIEYNKLLEQQVRLMGHVHPAGVALPTSNGSHISSFGQIFPAVHQSSAYYEPDQVGPSPKPENMHHKFGSCIPNAFTNGGSSVHASMLNAGEISARASRIDASTEIRASHCSNMNMMQGINGLIKSEVGGTIKSEVGYSGNSPYLLGPNNNVLEARPTIGDASIAPFSSEDSNSQALNKALIEPEASFGFLGQIPQTFLAAADFSHTSEILESYPHSPFLTTDSGNFEREHQGDNKRLDSISEGLSYDDFGSE